MSRQLASLDAGGHHDGRQHLGRLDHSGTTTGDPLGYPEDACSRLGHRLDGSARSFAAEGDGRHDQVRRADVAAGSARGLRARRSPVRRARSTGVEYHLVHGNPLFGDDTEVADLFLSEDCSLWFLRRSDRPEARSQWMGTMGPVKRHETTHRQREHDLRRSHHGAVTTWAKYHSAGADRRSPEWWGVDDWSRTGTSRSTRCSDPRRANPALQGFRLFPDRQRAPETKGEKAVVRSGHRGSAPANYAEAGADEWPSRGGDRRLGHR